MPREEAQAKLDEISSQIGQQMGTPGGTANEPQEPPQKSETEHQAQTGEEEAKGANGNGAGDSQPVIDEKEVAAREQGWVSLDEWTEQGKNPADWSGAHAFLRFRDMASNDKSLRSELRETKEGITKMLQQFDSMNQRQQQKHKSELQAAMKQAREENDFDGYEQAANQLSEIEQHQNTSASQVPQAEHVVIAQFRDENPKLLRSSGEFNEAFNTVMEQKTNELIFNRSNGMRNPLSDSALKQCLDDAYGMTEKLFPAPVQRQNRQPPATNSPSRGKKDVDPASKLDTAASETYSFIKKNQGERAAKRFAESYAKGA